jgi:S-DNA-T family DNA segregation ATPase FtsK/SpoIIIE
VFQKNKTRISELEAKIAGLTQEISTNEAKASALRQYGQLSMGKLKGYFASVLKDNARRFEETLAARPLASVAGWGEPRWQSWDPATSVAESSIRVGDLLEQRLDGGLRVPGLTPFIGQNRTIIIGSSGDSTEQGAALLQSLLVRTALMLPHQARYTLLDPAGHGIAFPMRRFLPQVQEHSGDVRRDLDQVIAQIQRIIENYLDASVPSFEAIPADLRVNEKFHFVFAADFPNRYDRRAIEALQSVGNTGPVAGTYVFIHYNRTHELPRDMGMNGFQNAVFVNLDDNSSSTRLNLSLRPDGPPSAELLGLQSKMLDEHKRRQQQPPLDWDKIVGLPEDGWWGESSTKTIESPIGVNGNGSRLGLWFGVNADNRPCAHGMLGAMTGAGKSNLYHVLISGLAVRYSPEELRLYLIDGKDGVEFQPYRTLPHAEVVSLRSSPELSRSVLAELIAEKERRNELFVRIGVNDFTSYRAKGEPEGRLPRILLLVDEYQELFEGDKDGVASSQLLQLAQQGRSAGIHMLLASQRFGAAGMLNQTGIFGNIHLLLAMKMKAADVQALTEFGRKGKNYIATCDLPGKIVVNDQGGDDGANVAGKVAYLRLERLDQLLQTLAEKSRSLPDESMPRRVVFNGKAQPSLADNPYLSHLLRHEAWMPPHELADFARQPAEAGGLGVIDWFPEEHPHVAWLGQQFNVRGQAMMVFRRRVSENAVIVGGANAARYGMLAAILASLAVNLDPSHARFTIIDRSIAGSRWNGMLQAAAESLLGRAGFAARFSTDPSAADPLLGELTAELDRRKAMPENQLVGEPSLFVMMTELDGIEALRRKPDAYGGLTNSPGGENLRRLYVEGPPLGIHLILSFSGVRPMTNVIDERRGLINFRHRVALQMSEDDSHTLTRGRRASQLQLEGPMPVCALYVDVENDTAVRFKPYSVDQAQVAQNESLVDQVRQIGEQLSHRRNGHER